ncbi:pyridoxamine 5'-phosphate oxidase family protein [Pseudonocardia humida]|uniref:Pyridoxamine 5'-phosphate oxidase family protein n=1 Tax=Pseudonocardia humida TaxID=2800819 RepID=A0ABT0ZTA8_9PSEU|nr:pyridoxamine 5'-phosphate oxidase family protein [Pseudonocardia humida]MCO1653961.1 pyridoxamine 5'-phosphate oxidase family protein [Pseudonocardia humida]
MTDPAREPVAERPHMPDYGVETAAWEPLPWSWAAERLRAGRNYWVVTASAAGRPHALPVWGAWDDGEQRFAFSCGPRSRKAANLAANPQVVVATDDTVECLSMEGRAVVVEDDARRRSWADRYLAKYRPVSPELTAGFVLANLVVEVAPERAFGIVEREDAFAARATRWRWPS